MPGAARLLLGTGALVMALGVVLGAISAHAAQGAAHPEAARLMQTAVQYQLVHGLGVLACGILGRPVAGAWLVAAAALFVLGIALFSGSLWVQAIGGRSPGTAGFGGIAFIAGWVALAVHALRSQVP